MEKKIYEKPTMTVVRLQASEMLLSSPTQNASVNARRSNYLNGKVDASGNDVGEGVTNGVWKWMDE